MIISFLIKKFMILTRLSSYDLVIDGGGKAHKHTQVLMHVIVILKDPIIPQYLTRKASGVLLQAAHNHYMAQHI